jgi:hypothetical protein
MDRGVDSSISPLRTFFSAFQAYKIHQPCIHQNFPYSRPVHRSRRRATSTVGVEENCQKHNPVAFRMELLSELEAQQKKSGVRTFFEVVCF